MHVLPRQNQKGSRGNDPPFGWTLRLELVAQRELKYSIGVGLSGNPSKSRRIDIRAWICKVGVVEHIESIGLELQKVLVGPGHGETLGQRHIEVYEARPTEIVSGANFTTERILQGRFGGDGVGEELNEAVVVVDAGPEGRPWSSLDGWAVKYESHGERASVCAEGEAGMCGEYSRHFPPPNDFVYEGIGAATQGPSATKGQIVNPVSGEQVGYVEVRRSAADTQIRGVTNQSTDDGVGDA